MNIIAANKTVKCCANYVNERLRSPYKETIEDHSPTTCYLMQLAQHQLMF